MAEGIEFAESNGVLGAPTPEDAQAGTVYGLSVHHFQDLDGRQHVMSKWKFTAEELEELNRNGGECWFTCWGTTHAPMRIFAGDPFVRNQETVDAL